LSPAAEGHIKGLQQWATQKGHHPERVRLAVWRIRAPFVIGMFSDLEPDPTALKDQQAYAADVKIVEFGIKREKLLLHHVPVTLSARTRACDG